MKILLVEDDVKQLEPIHTALSQAKHVVDPVQDGENAQALLLTREYDLLILDWMLPKISGIQLCRYYREIGKRSPILILTAKDGLHDKLAGLDAGADDYLVKPIDILELLARVRALGRRSQLWNDDMLCFSDLKLRLSTMTVEYQSKTVELSRKEFQLLEYFLRHPHQILTHGQIEQALWSWDIEPESNAMNKLVRRLRQRLRSIGAADWVESVYGVGYRLKPFASSCYMHSA
ncbi:MAG TPA: response regulator transcription factor [Chroococcidiopsis sp.]